MTELPDNTRWQLWIVAFGFFMQSLDTTIVNTALPSMAKSLGESPLHMHMVVVSYVLTVAVMLPASGWLADKIGVRNIFFAAIVLFTLGSLFCALSGTLNQLVLARVLQGVGGAMMVPVGRLTVMKIVPRAIYGGDDLRHPAGSDRAVTRPRAGRGAGGICFMALDLSDQYPGGNCRRYGDLYANAKLHHRDPAL